MKLSENFALKSDSYKVTHWPQYPPKTEYIGSYMESRGGIFKEMVNFGLQVILIKHFVGIRVTDESIEQARIFWKAHFGKDLMNIKMWKHIVDKWGGKLPLKIRAVPEGTVVPVHNVIMDIVNTDKECYSLVNFAETLLMHLWYSCTIASNSREIKKVILKYLQETGNPKLIHFMLHDFGYRGVTCDEQAGIGGASHLINFMGTDNAAGLILAMEYYDSGMVGFSIPASEHSTITSWGRDREKDAYENILLQFPTGLVACVSDSFNIYNACKKIWGEQLKPKILQRDGKLIVRPDSGDPVEVNRKLLNILWEQFPGTVNDKGYKVLNEHIGIIQGDGIDLEMVEKILKMCKEEGFAANNFAFGSGGGLLQKFNRDSLKFAIKCSYAIIDGEEVDVQKDPVTAKDKKSKIGQLKLVKDSNGQYRTLSKLENPEEYDLYEDELKTVFLNGDLLIKYSFSEIRDRAELKIGELQEA